MFAQTLIARILRFKLHWQLQSSTRLLDNRLLKDCGLSPRRDPLKPWDLTK